MRRKKMKKKRGDIIIIIPREKDNLTIYFTDANTNVK